MQLRHTRKQHNSSKLQETQLMNTNNQRNMKQLRSDQHYLFLIMQNANTKYHVSKEEIEQLFPALKNYFSYSQETIERLNIVHEVVSKLSVISNHWDPATVRKWFINNMQQYVKNYLYASPPPPIVEEEK